MEGGGKRRIFAIGNYVNQRLLKPIHDWLGKVLRRIPQDGTYDQTKPLDLLKGSRHCYSFDLKSATDRWPLLLLFELFQYLFDRSFASSVVNSTLACNIFEVPFVRRKPSTVSFVAGQPLGYHASWPLFALSHHVMVWYCAEKAYPGKTFTGYAVLGDDVVITDPIVGQEYAESLDPLGVTISYQKSLISEDGCAEFAKRFRVIDLTKDISPISVKCLLNSFHPFGAMAVHKKYGLKRFSSLVRINGGGYRTLGRLDHTRSLSVNRLRGMWDKSNLPFELWLGRGSPLNPYLKGYIVDLLRKEMRPRDITLVPDQLFKQIGMKDFLEWASLRGCMRTWLKYCHWYYQVAQSPDVNLEDFFKAPIVNRKWKLDREEPLVSRFGLMWKIYDLVAIKGCSFVLPIWTLRLRDSSDR